MIEEIKVNQLVNLVRNGMITVESIKNEEYKAAVIQRLSESKP